MPLVRLENVTKSYGAELVLDKINWQVSEGERIGLIGNNGTGKTTLFKIMTGEMKEYRGTVDRAKKAIIGHLHQEPQFEYGMKLREAVKLAAFQHMTELEREMEELTVKMSQLDPDEDSSDLLDKYAKLQERHEAYGGYNYEHQIDAVLGGLGFSQDDMKLKVRVLSGGQKGRAALAHLLLKQPELLLLDEPTNHLDLEGTEWLEGFLNTEFKGAVVVVSHDRYFLDKVVNKVVELHDNILEEYSGNYTSFMAQKERRLLVQQRQYERQQEEIKKDLDFIARYKAGQRSKEARGREKKLDRMELIEKPRLNEKQIKLDFDTDIRGGDDILLLRDVSKVYGDKVLFQNLTAEIYRHDRVGIIGPNGIGKTTLLKLILGEEEPTSGVVWVGHNLRIGYYDQEHASLNLENTVLDEIWELRPDDTQGEVRSYLGRFLFSGEEVFKIIGDLSGGEQSRIALAKLLMEKANFLVLDEPTNHLDISSKEVLEEALLDYPATSLIVSHDRYFLDKIVNKILFIEQDKAWLWTGNYTEYQNWKQRKKAEEEKKAAEERKRIVREKKKNEAGKKKKKKKKKPKRWVGM
ncbi:ATP-binding cassette domain-containing protein [Candidatus Poribacteria bacterium]|nr:ATP-binding cassette domain-containing protein [Candidatus Poribacteria bacterium]